MTGVQNCEGTQFDKMTPEKRAEMGRKGGLAAAESKKRKKAMKDTLEVLLSMPIKKGKATDAEQIRSFAELKGKNINVQEAMLVAMIQRAMKGNVAAAEYIRDTVGENPTANVNLSGGVGVTIIDDLGGAGE